MVGRGGGGSDSRRVGQSVKINQQIVKKIKIKNKKIKMKTYLATKKKKEEARSGRRTRAMTRRGSGDRGLCGAGRGADKI